jgi:hypothetical protein
LLAMSFSADHNRRAMPTRSRAEKVTH